MDLLSKFIHYESGATAIEYGLLSALLGISMIAGAKSIGVEITNLFAGTDSELSNALNE